MVGPPVVVMGLSPRRVARATTDDDLLAVGHRRLMMKTTRATMTRTMTMVYSITGSPEVLRGLT
jgi:hypothetical protein